MTDTTPNYINIIKDVKDPNYRYKMPEAEVKIEGHGQYLRTIIPNLDKIANSLLTSPEILNHYLGLSLGTNSGHQTKSDHLFVQGEHSQKKIQKFIYKYIDEFLMCPKCKIPDTCFKITKTSKKKKELSIVCQSCGTDSVLSNTKIDSKMVNYIINNPPDNKEHRQMETQENHSVSNFGEMFSFDMYPNKMAGKEQQEDEPREELDNDVDEVVDPSPVTSPNSESPPTSSCHEIILKEVVIDLRPELARYNSSSSSNSDSSSDNEDEIGNKLPEPNLFKELENNLEIEIQEDDAEIIFLEIPSPSELKPKPERNASPLFKKPAHSYTPSYQSSYSGYSNQPKVYENKYASLSNHFASRVMSQGNNDRGSLLANEVRDLMRVSRSTNMREKQQYLYNFLEKELLIGNGSPYTDFNFSIQRVKTVSKHLRLESLVAGLMTDILVTRDCHGFYRQIRYFSKYYIPFIEGTHAEKAQTNVLDAIALIFVKRNGNLDIDSIMEELYLNNIVTPDVMKEWFLNGSNIISDDDMEDVKYQLGGIIEQFMYEDEHISDYEDTPPDYFNTLIHADGSVWEQKPQRKKNKKKKGLRGIVSNLINYRENSSDSSSSESSDPDDIMPELEFDDSETQKEGTQTTNNHMQSYLS